MQEFSSQKDFQCFTLKHKTQLRWWRLHFHNSAVYKQCIDKHLSLLQCRVQVLQFCAFSQGAMNKCKSTTSKALHKSVTAEYWRTMSRDTQLRIIPAMSYMWFSSQAHKMWYKSLHKFHYGKKEITLHSQKHDFSWNIKVVLLSKKFFKKFS